MDARTYHDVCAAHDWYHEWSDDHGAYLRGQRERSRLREAAELSAGLMEIWEAWNAYAYSGARFGTPQAIRPGRPYPDHDAPSTFGGKMPPVIPGQLSLLDSEPSTDAPKRRVLFGEAA